MKLAFDIPCVPPTVTAQQKGQRIVMPKGKKPFVHHFTKPEVEAAERLYSALLHPHRPAKPLEGPLKFSLLISYPFRKSESKKARANGPIWCDTSPDWDNIPKLICDTMTKLGFWRNDSQIAHGTTVKQWADWSGIKITVEELNQTTGELL